MYRRLVVDPRHTAFIAGYQRAVHDLRGEMSAAHFSTLVELNMLRRELRELRAMHERALEAMQQAQARQRAHAEHRERAIARARAAERDPAMPLQ